MEPIEAAFSWGEGDNGWFARVTANKCPVCGRRTCELKKGPGHLVNNLPLTIECKNHHKILVVPWRFQEEKEDTRKYPR